MVPNANLEPKSPLEPGVDCHGAAVEVEHGDEEAAHGARVRGQDPGDEAGLDFLVGGEHTAAASVEL